MDDLSEGAGVTAGMEVMAVVTRRFSPSRIERQLLQRAFELICGGPKDEEASADDGQRRMDAACAGGESPASRRRAGRCSV